jgi:hypothetical protein
MVRDQWRIYEGSNRKIYKKIIKKGELSMKKHFVTFYSPGTLVAETTTKEIKSWNVDEAVKMSKRIKERHGALPYGFVFSTRSRGAKDFNSKQTKQSKMYYLGGTVLTLKQIKERNSPKDRILISNMENNGWNKVIENNNSWKVTQPFVMGDVVLNIK